MCRRGRVCVWDNLKCILIFLVVVGHFVNQFEDESAIMRSISIMIYSFHMPLFIFLSGLLERRWDKDRAFSWNKPVYYILIGYLLKVAIFAIKIFFGRDAEFSFFSDTGCPWYMFAMSAFMVLAYILQGADWHLVLPVSILASCLAGYVPEIGSFLYLSRILVFFPFYYVGFLMRPEKVRQFLHNKYHKYMKAGAFVVLAGVAFVSLIWIDDIYSYIRLLTGRNAYVFINIDSCGAWHRLAYYGISVVIGTAVMSLVPDRNLSLAGVIGQRTLQIYFWHRLVLYVLMYSGFADWIKETLPCLWISAYLLIAVILTLALALNLFGLPLKYLKQCEMRIGRRLAAAVH